MEKKTEVMHVRCTKKQKNLLKGKAKLYGKTLSQFILEELIGAHGKMKALRSKS